MASSHSELNVGDDFIENVGVTDKETLDSTKHAQYLEKYHQFIRLQQESSKVDLKSAHKIVSLIKSENGGEDALENMSNASSLLKAKFILKHNIQNQPPFCPSA